MGQPFHSEATLFKLSHFSTVYSSMNYKNQPQTNEHDHESTNLGKYENVVRDVNLSKGDGNADIDGLNGENKTRNES